MTFTQASSVAYCHRHSSSKSKPRPVILWSCTKKHNLDGEKEGTSGSAQSFPNFFWDRATWFLLTIISVLWCLQSSTLSEPLWLQCLIILEKQYFLSAKCPHRSAWSRICKGAIIYSSLSQRSHDKLTGRQNPMVGRKEASRSLSKIEIFPLLPLNLALFSILAPPPNVRETRQMFVN